MISDRPLVEYYPKAWLDLTGELVTGFSRLSAEEDSFEATVAIVEAMRGDSR